jgi:hypothetical protein
LEVSPQPASPKIRVKRAVPVSAVVSFFMVVPKSCWVQATRNLA